MFFREANFSHQGRDYVLTEQGKAPLQRGFGRLELVDGAGAEAVVVLAISMRAADPDGRLLACLGIEQHPHNLHPGQLEQLVRQRLRGSFRPDLYRRVAAPSTVEATRSSTTAKPAVPLPRASPTPSHYVVMQALFANKAPVPGVRLELVCAGGEVRTTMTGQDGCVRMERLPAAPLSVRVVSLDSSMWRALEGEPARPSSEESTLRWHEVKSGECLTVVAHRYGIRSWKLLWEHPKNQPLRQKRRSPHVLLPGDQVAVPGVRVHELVRPVDATHHIEVQSAPNRKVRVRFQNLAGEPIADLAYRCSVAGKQESGTAPTNVDGWLEETVPLATDVIELELARRQQTLAIKLGALHPLRDEDTKRPIGAGIWARLCALGYAAGAPTDTLTPEVVHALQSFQSLAMKRDEPTGELDESTVSELARVALV